MGGISMSKGYHHPKKQGPKCALCKRWNGDAEVTFFNPQMGFTFKMGVFGICMVNNAQLPSSCGVGFRNYEPSVEASRLL